MADGTRQDDTLIEFQAVDGASDGTHPKALPGDARRVGGDADGEVGVYIRYGALCAAESLAARDTARETGSLLVGYAADRDGQACVVVEAAIEAKYADSKAASLTFTHATWNYVSECLERDYPGRVIVGWQHSHPGYGVFLSEYDLFIHKNFFSLPFQVALVIDPVAGERGFFGWTGDAESDANGPRKLSGYYLYGAPEAVGTPKLTARTKGPAPARRGWIAAALIALFLLLAAQTAYFAVRAARFKARETELSAEITEVKDALAAQAAEQAARDAAQDETVQADESGQAQADEASSAAVTLPEGTVVFVAHTVETGDTLTKICETYGVSYAANARIIAAVNGLDDPDLLRVGQVILIPVPAP